MVTWLETTSVPEGASEIWQVGPLELHVYNDRSGWRIASRLTDTSPRDDDELVWRKWAGPVGTLRVSLAPLMPDRVVLVKSDVPTNIPHGSSSTLYVGLPVFVKITSTGDPRFDLGELSTYPFSNAWHGDTMGGEPSYSYFTTIHRDWEDVTRGDATAMVPLKVKNSSDEVLEFQTLAIRAPHLTLFQGATRIWSSPMTIVYLGPDRVSDVAPSANPPDVDGPHTPLSPPRRGDKSLTPLKSFPKFKTIMGF